MNELNELQKYFEFDVDSQEWRMKMWVESKILQLIDAKKTIASIESQIKDGLLKVMQDNNITGAFKGNGYTISRASRNTIKFVGDEIPQEFAMTVVDMAKVKAKQVLEGTLPDGFVSTDTDYLVFKGSK